MVAHQNIGMDLYLIFPTIFLELVQVDRIIIFREKTGLAVIAALDDVVRNTGQAQARTSRHR